MSEVKAVSNSKVGTILELLQRVSSIHDPQELQREFSRRMTEFTRYDAYVAVSKRGLADGQYKITRMLLNKRDFVENSVNPWKQWNQLPVYRGGLIGELIATPIPKIIQKFSLTNDPVVGDRLAPFASLLACPIFDEGGDLNWSLVLRKGEHAFTEDDVSDFMLRGNLIGRMTKHLLAVQEVKALNSRLTSQLEEIAKIQMSLLPAQTPEVPGLGIATSYLTSDEAGGDYYDFFDMGDGKFGVLVADVSGHGAGAATVMAMLQTILHGFQERNAGPAEMLEHANRQLMAKKIQNNFITAFFSVFDPERRTVISANAGHHFPRVRHGDGSVTSLPAGHAIPLGILDDVEYRAETTSVAPHDTIVYYTDGITEAFSPPPQPQMFGTPRLDGALVECSGEPPCVVDSIHEALYEHTQSRERADDQTIVALRVLE